MKTISAFLVFSGLIFLPAAQAHDLKLTIYDDGRSCPGNCDAHAVLNDADNGTLQAYQPGTRDNPKKCAVGESCEICFGHEPDSCMVVLYRGSGPPAGKVDFTPAFYNTYCDRADIPQALARQCSLLDTAVTQRGYDKRLNCVAGDANEKCSTIITEAQAAYDADLPLYNECIRVGEEKFNSSQPDDHTRRKYDCAYSELKTGGPNSNGVRWRRLLPAACRPGTFVGRDGLDCCGGQPRIEAALHPECVAFYPEQ